MALIRTRLFAIEPGSHFEIVNTVLVWSPRQPPASCIPSTCLFCHAWGFVPPDLFNMEHVRTPIASFALHCCSYPIGTCLNRICLQQIFRDTCAVLLFEEIQDNDIKHTERERPIKCHITNYSGCREGEHVQKNIPFRKPLTYSLFKRTDKRTCL